MPFDLTLTEEEQALLTSHLAQIDALTAPGLSDEERIRRFGEAAEWSDDDIHVRLIKAVVLRWGPAHTAWEFGVHPRSLFGDLPGCKCPVLEARYGRASYPGIPDRIPPNNWSPDRETLLCFARVQQEKRVGRALV